ncbi:MAG: gliding motility-associated C-terminal domain-containing protein [Lewinellaceae bacterium]|nr:gliding motility-associated C-terminal domain-containing protein [Lewinellaceae bacterium]
MLGVIRWMIVFGSLIFLKNVVYSQCLTIDVPDDLTICDPTDVNLIGNISGNYFAFDWTSDYGFFDATNINTWAFVDRTTVFTLTGYGNPITNVIVNGDFSQGNTGFTTDYTASFPGYTCPSGNQVYGVLGCEGTYVIGPNSGPTHTNFADCYDHTGGGNMMMVNGASSLQNIWCQTVAVMPNTTYIFQAFATSLNSSSPAILQFSIDGGLLGSPFGLSGATCTWEEFYATWDSGSSTSVTICVTNQNTAASGNDFALDDIYFGPLCEEELSFTVTYDPFEIAVNSGYIINCNQPTASLDVFTIPLNNYQYQWSTYDGNIVSGSATSNVIVDAGGDYFVTVTDANQCTKVEQIVVAEDFTKPSIIIEGDTILNCDFPSTQLSIGDISGLEFIQWTFPDFTTSFDSGILVTNPGVYLLDVTGFNGCTSHYQREVKFDQSELVLNIDSIGVLTCSDTTAIIKLSIPSPFDEIRWMNTSIDTILDNGLTAIVHESGVYTANIKLTNGCVFAKEFKVDEIGPNFSYAIGTLDTLTCSKTSVPIPISLNNNNHVLWPISPFYQIGDMTYADQAGKYYINIIDSLGCITLDSLEIMENKRLSNVTVRVDSIDCVDKKGGFFVENIDAKEWFWLEGNGYNSMPYAEFGQEGTYHIVLIGENGCKDTASYVLPSNVKYPRFQTQVSDIDCVNTIGNLIVITDPSNQVTWSTISGKSGIGTDILSNQSEVIFIKVSTADGCFLEDTFDIKVDTLAPTLSISPLIDTLTCLKMEVKPLVQATDFTSILWSNIEPLVNNNLRPTITEPGRYILTLTNGNGCITQDSILILQDVSKPLVYLDFDTLTCLLPNTKLEVVDYHGEVLSLISPDQSQKLINNFHSISEAGIYAMHVIKSNGCDTLINFTVREDKEVPTLFVEDAVLTCYEPEAKLQNTIHQNRTIQYTWTDSGGIAVSTSDFIDVKEASILFLTAQYDNGCTEKFGPISTAEDKQKPEILFLGETLLTCKDSVQTIGFESIGIINQRKWFFNQVEIDSSYEIQISDEGIYHLVVENLLNGCVAEDSIQVFRAPFLDTFNINLEHPKCVGELDFFEIDKILGGTAPYTLQLNNDIVSLNGKSLESGEYHLQLTDTNLCVKSIDFTVIRPIEIVVDAGSDLEILRGESVKLSPSFSSNTSIFEWESNSTLDCLSCPEPEASPLESQVYVLTVYDENGCSAQDDVQVRVKFDKGVIAPNIVNVSSHLNNRFTIYPLYTSVEEIEYIKIYDRWGNLVFMKEHLLSGDTSQGWDMTFGGQTCEEGVYIWIASIKYVDGSDETVSGDVTLIK